MRIRLAVLLILSLSCGEAFAFSETLLIQPTVPSPMSNVALVYAGILSGPVTIDAVVLERVDNHFTLTVSRQDYANGYGFPYSGTAPLGKLAAGHYTADLFVRYPTILIVDGMETIGYGPPTFAAAVSFDVGVFAIPTTSRQVLVLLSMLLSLVGGGYAARNSKGEMVR